MNSRFAQTVSEDLIRIYRRSSASITDVTKLEVHFNGTMKKAEVRDLIYAALLALVKDKGFRLKKGIDGGLFRLIPGGNQSIGVPLWDYGATFSFSLVVTIRLDVVEEIANKFNLAPAKLHSGTTTYIIQLVRFMPPGTDAMETKFAVVTPEDIKDAVASLKPLILERIIPFLDQTQDVPTLASAINFLDIPKILPSGGPAEERQLVLMKLTKHPDFEAAVSIIKDRISQYPQHAKDRFDNFVKYLRELDVNLYSNRLSTS